MGAMDLVKKNTIYLVGEDRNEIVWIGEVNQHNNFLDKQYRGQYYTKDLIKEYFKEEITLEDAIRQGLIKFNRFSHMNSSDKQDTIKMMLKLNGIAETLNFLCQTDLCLSEEDLKAILNFKKS